MDISSGRRHKRKMVTDVLWCDSQPVTMWIAGFGMRQYYVKTIIVENTYRFAWFMWKRQRIKQTIPHIDSAYYDGEKSSNDRANMIARERKFIAQQYLDLYRNGHAGLFDEIRESKRNKDGKENNVQTETVSEASEPK